MESGHRVARDDHRGADVVLGLDFFGRCEILADAEGPPGAVLAEADAQILRDEPLTPIDELAAGQAVDEIHAEALFPTLAPVRLVEALDDEYQVPHRAADACKPGIVGVRVVRIGGEQADDRAERALGAEQRTAGLVRIDGVRVTVREIAVDDFPGGLEIGLEVIDEDRGGDHRVG